MANPSDFIEADYRPIGLAIKDPRSMKLESLVEFFKHISQRETSHGIPNAFRFKSVLSSRKSSVMRPANYRHGAQDEDNESQAPPVRRKRRKKASLSGHTAVLNPDISEDVSETPANVPTGRPNPQATAPVNITTGRSNLQPTTPVNIATGRPTPPAISGLHTPKDTPPPDTRRHSPLNRTPASASTLPNDISAPEPQRPPAPNRSQKSKHLSPASVSRRSLRSSVINTHITPKTKSSKKNTKNKSKNKKG